MNMIRETKKSNKMLNKSFSLAVGLLICSTCCTCVYGSDTSSTQLLENDYLKADTDIISSEDDSNSESRQKEGYIKIDLRETINSADTRKTGIGQIGKRDGITNEIDNTPSSNASPSNDGSIKILKRFKRCDGRRRDDDDDGDANRSRRSRRARRRRRARRARARRARRARKRAANRARRSSSSIQTTITRHVIQDGKVIEQVNQPVMTSNTDCKQKAAPSQPIIIQQPPVIQTVQQPQQAQALTQIPAPAHKGNPPYMTPIFA